jgi:hypothetical protein
VGYAFYALRPELLVELRVEADVGGAHRLLRELDDGLDGVRGALLEAATVDTLVEVDRVLARHDVLERGAGLAAGLLALSGGCLRYGWGEHRGIWSERLIFFKKIKAECRAS